MFSGHLITENIAYLARVACSHRDHTPLSKALPYSVDCVSRECSIERGSAVQHGEVRNLPGIVFP